ncbi:MAG: dephospho-CoA kinase [Deltaproteobacteria bacterium]|nr:dephospho-CoA kinase [Deltaproteobacteria bacterium]
MLNIGLTGGIGSGKSTVDLFFREEGAYIIDFDELAHSVEEPDRPAWTGIVAAFGHSILNENGTINREKLGAIVFSDREKLKKLNEIVHPAVIEEWKRRIAEIQKKDGRAIVISDIPLLFEAGLQSLFDMVILVHISPEEQIRRVMKRNSYNREQAQNRLRAQMPIDKKITLADFVINNEGTLDQTRTIVHEVWQRLTEEEQKKGRIIDVPR